MGFGGISMWQLIIVLVIILLLFGTKKLRNIGGDLGSAVKGFKKAMNNDADKASVEATDSADDKQINAKEGQDPASTDTNATNATNASANTKDKN